MDGKPMNLGLSLPPPPKSKNPIKTSNINPIQLGNNDNNDGLLKFTDGLVNANDLPVYSSFPLIRPIYNWRSILLQKYPEFIQPILEEWDKTEKKLPKRFKDSIPILILVLCISPKFFFILMISIISIYIGILYGISSQSKLLDKMINDYSKTINYGSNKSQFRSRLKTIMDISQSLPINNIKLENELENELINNLFEATDFNSFMTSLINSISDSNIKFQLNNMQKHYQEQMSLDIEFAVVEEEIPFNILEYINRISYHIVRDFIYNWFINFNHSKQSEFPTSVHNVLKYSIIRLGLRIRRVKPLDIILPLSKTLIYHIQEYRNFEDSRLNINEYNKKYPKSYFSQCSTDEIIINKLKEISMRLVIDILPRNDRSSESLFSLLTEIISTTVFLPLLNLLSDPDWLNQKIVEILETPQEKLIRLENDPLAAANSAGVDNVKAHAEAEMVKDEDERNKLFNKLKNNYNYDDIKSPNITNDNNNNNNNNILLDNKDILYCADTNTVINSNEGKLIINIVEAKRLHITKNANFVYCSVLSGSTIKYTSKLTAEVDPMWCEQFTFKLSSKDKKAIKSGQGIPGIVIDIYESRLLKDELLGSVHIPFNKIPMNKKSRGWFKIDVSSTRFSKREGISAQLQLEVLFEDPEITKLLKDGKRRREASQPIQRMSTSSNLFNRNSGMKGLLYLEPIVNEDGIITIVGNNGNKILIDKFNKPYITSKMILIENEAFMEFMVYIDDKKGSDYIQLWVMIDSFVRLANTQSTTNSNSYVEHNEIMQGVKEDALAILDLYFQKNNKPNPEQNINLGDGIENIIKSIREQIQQMVIPQPAIMRPLQERILEIIQDRFIPDFIKSDKFNQYLNDIGIKLNNDGTIMIDGNNMLSPLPSPSIKPDIDILNTTIQNDEDNENDNNINEVDKIEIINEENNNVNNNDKLIINPILNNNSISKIDSPISSTSGIDLTTVNSVTGHVVNSIVNNIDVDLDNDLYDDQLVPKENIIVDNNNNNVNEINIKSKEDDNSFGANLLTTDEKTIRESLINAANAVDQIHILAKNNTLELPMIKNAIELIKEKVHILDKLMTNQQNIELLNDLSIAKIQLQRDVENLSDVLEQIENMPTPVQIDEPRSSIDVLDLSDVEVLITDATDGQKLKNYAKSPANIAFAGLSGSSNVPIKMLVFAIQVTRTLEDGGWVITRNYSEFIKLYEDLSSLFPKVSKTNFPIRNTVQLKTLLSQEQRDILCNDLQIWLNLILPDSQIYSATAIQIFMRPENINLTTSSKQKEKLKERDAMLKKKYGNDMLASASIRKQILGGISSAGSLLRKIAVDTPLIAVSIVQNNIDNAVHVVTGSQSSASTVIPSTTKIIKNQDNENIDNINNKNKDKIDTIEITNNNNSSKSIESDNLKTSSLSVTASSINLHNRGVTEPPIKNMNKRLSKTFDDSKSSSSSTATANIKSSIIENNKLENNKKLPKSLSLSTNLNQSINSNQINEVNETNKKIKLKEDIIDPQTRKASLEWFELHSITDNGLELLLDCLFGLIDELFYLSEPNQWIRQKGLLMMKSLLRRSYGNLISNAIQTRSIAAKSPTKIIEYLNIIDRNLWPFGIWFNTDRMQIQKIIDTRINTLGSIIPGFSEREAESVVEFKLYLATKDDKKNQYNNDLDLITPNESNVSTPKAIKSNEKNNNDDYFYYDTKKTKTRIIDMNKTNSKNSSDIITNNSGLSLPSNKQDESNKRFRVMTESEETKLENDNISEISNEDFDNNNNNNNINEESDNDNEDYDLIYQAIDSKSVPYEADLDDEEVIKNNRRLTKLGSNSDMSKTKDELNSIISPINNSLSYLESRSSTPINKSSIKEETITAGIFIADEEEKERIFATHGLDVKVKNQELEKDHNTEYELDEDKLKEQTRLWRKKYVFGSDGRAKLWDKKWEYGGFERERDLPPIVIRRTEEMMTKTKMEAKKLFTNPTRLSSNIDNLSRVLGRGTTVQGLTRLFNMIQQRQINKQLVLILLDEIVKVLLETQ